MGDLPATRPSLLVRIRDAADKEAWQQFVSVYAPVVYGFARKHGLQDSDAGDLTQDVFLAVSGAVNRLDYDPKRGLFRGWLFTVARNKLHDFLHARQRRQQASGGSDAQVFLEEQPARDEDLWEAEYRQHLFLWAVEQVKGRFEESSWRAFWSVAVEGMAPKQPPRNWA